MSDNTMHPKIAGIRNQRTYCMVKPDGVARGLIGEIIHRIEKAGLKVVAMKVIVPTKEQATAHLPYSDEAWIERLGTKTLGTFEDLQLDAKDLLGSDDKRTVGKEVADNLIQFLCSGPVVCIIVEGVQAIDMVRKLAGHTLPFKAEMGTIRGDFSVDSPAIANMQKRPVHNLFHASENESEAQNEMQVWFTPEEISTYIRTGEEVMFNRTY
jgi:nucleoside-diphosphate kinase